MELYHGNSVFCCNEKQFDRKLSNCYRNRQFLPPPKSTKSFPIGTIKKNRNEENQLKKIGVGTSITVKVRYIDEKIREVQIRRIRKEMVEWM